MKMKLSRLIACVLAAVSLVALSSCGSSKKIVAEAKPGMTAEEAIYHEMLQNKLKKDQLRQEVLKEAYTWQGTPYLYGGQTRKGIDCSALVVAAYKAVGVEMPRTSAQQCAAARKINKKKLKPADLIFFHSGKKGKGVSHVGIYMGNGLMIHASSSRGVIVSSLDEEYYKRHLHSCGKVLP